MKWLLILAVGAAVFFMSENTIARKIAQAIARLEGYGLEGAIPTDYHNPGDLENWPGYPVGSRGNGQITKFPDVGTGWAALVSDITNHMSLNPLQTIAEFGAEYSGGDPGYGERIAQALGVSPFSTLGSLL